MNTKVVKFELISSNYLGHNEIYPNNRLETVVYKMSSKRLVDQCHLGYVQIPKPFYKY